MEEENEITKILANVLFITYTKFIRLYGEIYETNPRLFNRQYNMRGVLFKGEKRGNQSNPKIHQSAQRGIAVRSEKSILNKLFWGYVKVFQVATIILSNSEYPEIDCFKYPFEALDKQNFKVLDGEIKEKTKKEMKKFNPRDDTILIYSGNRIFGSSDNIYLKEHIGTNHPIRFCIYFGCKGPGIWVVAYVKCTHYEEMEINGKRRHVFYFSLI
jgi:hypothetical protein